MSDSTRCSKCGLTIQWPPYGAVSKGVAAMPMNGGNRGWQVLDDNGAEIALCSYTINDCHACGKKKAQEKLLASGKLGVVQLVRYALIDGIGRIQEVIEE